MGTYGRKSWDLRPFALVQNSVSPLQIAVRTSLQGRRSGYIAKHIPAKRAAKCGYFKFFHPRPRQNAARKTVENTSYSITANRCFSVFAVMATNRCTDTSARLSDVSCAKVPSPSESKCRRRTRTRIQPSSTIAPSSSDKANMSRKVSASRTETP